MSQQFTAGRKIHKKKGKTTSELEEQIAQAMFDLELSVKEIQADLKKVFFYSAKEITFGGSKKAVVIFVPLAFLRNYHRIQSRLVRELEKKLSKTVVVIGQRRIIKKPKWGNVVVPRKNTMTYVHEAILEDLVYPTDVVGRRQRIRLDGTRHHKIYLDSRDQSNVEAKLDTFAAVYRRLTGKTASFEFAPQQE
eukprot:TRINITY_DN95_c0_g1_i3.p2 TRINITY_DN95_c0_g1~~TRINITY_DN95_c0_g1_i3.p2  ORF type:complete len:193 (+),score=116.18 TRINITY_DN95_c0_g1_i3:65-643(+)